MSDPINNPDVRPARWYEWTGWWSMALELLLYAQGAAGMWTNPPRWVNPILVALPFVIRFVRTKASSMPQSFRRVNPPDPGA